MAHYVNKDFLNIGQVKRPINIEAKRCFREKIIHSQVLELIYLNKGETNYFQK